VLHRASCCLASLACRWCVSITQLIVAVIHCTRRCHAHPNIVQLKEVFLTVHHLAVVMEYMKGSNMPTYLAKHAPLPEPVARCTPFKCSSSFQFAAPCAGRAAAACPLGWLCALNGVSTLRDMVRQALPALLGSSCLQRFCVCMAGLPAVASQLYQALGPDT